MDEALELANYLPLSFRSPEEQEYISFLWDAFETNYTHGKYQFAFLAYHMLTMSFVYFNIWQIKQVQPEDFAMGLIGFAREEKALLDATSPFDFSIVPESTMLRFLRLIACDNSEIGTYIKLVKDRNDTAHPNGHLYYRQQSALDIKIRQVLHVVAQIQAHSKSVIEQCYERFLVDNSDPDYREYADDGDQIRELLVHKNYLSFEDMKFCVNYDLGRVEDHCSFEGIEALHMSVCQLYFDAQDSGPYVP
jgi:hypothetical protein